MLWDATLPDRLRFRGAPLAGPTDTDVAIVGAGYTGLWTAHALRRADPTLRVTVLERRHVGFGASGRNGGWCSALLPMSLGSIARRHGRPAAVRMQRAMHATVAEVVATCAAEGIDAQVAHGGTVDLVRTPAQRRRARAHLSSVRSFGFGDDDLRWADAAEATSLCGAVGVLGALVTPHCAALHPARLVHGLAHAVADAGVAVHEHTEVVALGPGHVDTEHGRVRAEVVVRATEGHTATLPGARREMLPIYSMMIATDPLPAETWRTLGLAARPTFADGRHTVIYGQRTADDRIAFGGRGAPYHAGSRVRPEFDTDERVRRRLVATLHGLFPQLADVAVPYHWGGALGVPRDLHAGVRFDRTTGLAVAGGYVGDGVATSNLAGRTLADLITGADSDLVRLPWVGHRSRRWEPEPFRWLGVNAVRLGAEVADRVEATERFLKVDLKGRSRVRQPDQRADARRR